MCIVFYIWPIISLFHIQHKHCCISFVLYSPKMVLLAQPLSTFVIFEAIIISAKVLVYYVFFG